jgi:non-heme chloroperoxidase
MTTHRITGGGSIRLNVVETGNACGHSILFIHGFSQCWLTWSRQLNSDLAAKRAQSPGFHTHVVRATTLG